MPIYEYRCSLCSCDFEFRRKFGDDSGASCPKCNGDGQRIFSAVPIIFKGSGFYVTDSRAKNSAAEGSNGSKEPSSASDTKETSSGGVDNKTD